MEAKMISVAFAMALLSFAAAAQQQFKPTTVTYGTPGSTAPVTQTTTVPLHTTKSGTQFGGYSSTTVNGGSQLNGSGQVVQNTNRGSTSSTSAGVSITIPLGNGK